MRRSRLIHGPWEDEREIPTTNRVKDGKCDCRLCQKREQPSTRWVGSGTIIVRQPLPADVERARQNGRARGVLPSDPLWVMDLSGLGKGTIDVDAEDLG